MEVKGKKNKGGKFYAQLPVMILQMFPIAVTCGNTFVLKPCEKNPGNSFSIGSCIIL